VFLKKGRGGERTFIGTHGQKLTKRPEGAGGGGYLLHGFSLRTGLNGISLATT